MAVYILKFSRPLGNPQNRRGQARYYVGFTRCPIWMRLKVHRDGYGAAITRAAVQQGIQLNIVWCSSKGNRQLEKQIKRYKNVEKWIKAHPQRRNRAHNY